MEQEKNSNFLDEQSALISSASEKLLELQSLVQKKDSVIRSLHVDLEEQKLRRAEDTVLVETKASKIKQWVSTRLRDLENQNEKLRKQNLKCQQQLQVLQTCERNSKMWRSSLLGSSNEGSLHSASMADSEKDGNDFHPIDLQFVSVTNQEKTASVERILSCSTNSIRTETRLYTNLYSVQNSSNNKENCLKRNANQSGRLLPHSNPGSPMFQRRISRSKGKLVIGDANRADSLPRNSKLSKTSRSPSEPRRKTDSQLKKPVPKPRKKDSGESIPPPIFQPPELDTAARAYLIGDDILRIERDSLMQNSATSGGLKADSRLEITDSMCNLMDRDSLGGDYVNLVEIQSYAIGGDKEQPPKPPAHRSMPSWEKKLYDLAQQCLATADECKGRESVFSIGDMTSRTSDGRIVSPRTNSSGSQKMSKESSSSSFTLPVFTTRHGKVARTSGNHSPRKPTSDPSTSTDLEPSSSPHPYTSGGSSGFENRSSAGSSNKNLPNGSSPSNQTSQVTMKPNASTDVSRDDWTSELSRNASRTGTAERTPSSSEDDYAIPPDAYERSDGLGSPVEVLDMDGSMLEASESMGITHEEKSGYLNQMGDVRSKSWKRRWFVLVNGELKIFKTKNDQNKQPLSTISMTNVTSVKKVHNKAGTAGFELTSKSGAQSLTAETPAATLEWIKALQTAQKASAAHNVIQKVATSSAFTTKGWVTKVKFGHSKHYFAMLIDNQLAFFKASTAKVPVSQMQIQGTEIQEVTKSSDDSASDDGTASPYEEKQDSTEYSIQIQANGQETVYLVLNKREDKERWFYHLKIASRDGALCGTPFEILIQNLMQENGNFKSKLWSGRIFMNVDESIKSAMTSMHMNAQKDAIGLYKSSYLFTTVPMQASAIQYHIDLAQNALSTALKSEDLQNELIAQLIKLSGSDLIMKIQAWKLLALAVSLFVPTKYAVLWMLRKHMERWACCFELPQSSLAQYASRSLERTNQNGPRKEAPSKIEAMSLLIRNPSEHSLPHSIPVVLPDGNYHVIGFDGSSTIQECLQELCCSRGLRHQMYSGYMLYSDDPFKNDVVHALSPKQKLCDVISQWERQLKEGKVGKVPSGKVIKLYFKQRFYWPHLTSGETQLEKIYRAYSAGAQIQKGHIPVSPELAEELCALLGQMHFGDLKAMETEWYDGLVARFYPERLLQVACKATLRSKLAEHWQDLKGSSQHDCARVLLGVLRRWPFFGGQVFKSTMRWRNEEVVWLTVNDTGVHLLSSQTSAMNAIASYSYNSILQFGGCRDDFMLTISRNSNSLDEPSKERLIFAMPKEEILELTLLIKDYIKVRKLLSPPGGALAGKRNVAAASPRRSPRKAVGSNKKSDT